MSEYPTIHGTQMYRETPSGLMMGEDTAAQDEFEEAQEICDIHVDEES
tara:strand:+ start:956 stop:1099 length:144 start_codon:yes stop_codon:yes gene_type:complete